MHEDKHTKNRGILNCRVSFEYECPLTWELLEVTDDSRKRMCSQCAKPVFWCHDVNEAALRAEQGECIAVPLAISAHVRAHQDDRVMILGQPGLAFRRELEAAYVAALNEDT